MDRDIDKNPAFRARMSKAENIYKLVGYVLESCQVFEGNLKLMLDLLVQQNRVQIDKDIIPEVIFYRNNKTIGTVLSVLIKDENIIFTRKEKAVFYSALDARNYLVHRFFNGKILAAISSDKMIRDIENEIHVLWDRVKKAIDLVMNINKVLWSLENKDPDMLEKIYESVVTAAAEGDQSVQEFLKKMSAAKNDNGQDTKLQNIISEILKKYPTDQSM